MPDGKIRHCCPEKCFINQVVGVAGFNFRVTSTEAGKKKAHHEEPGTAKLNNEELKRLEQGMVKEASKSTPVKGPVVQVNTLPDEYTQVIEEDDE